MRRLPQPVLMDTIVTSSDHHQTLRSTVFKPAGSTPFFSGGRRGAVADVSEETDVPMGSPTTVSRKLLQPVLMDTIKSLRTRSVLGLGAQGAAAFDGMTPSIGAQTPAPRTAFSFGTTHSQMSETPTMAAGKPLSGPGEHSGNVQAQEARVAARGLVQEPAESAMSKQGALTEQERCDLKLLASFHILSEWLPRVLACQARPQAMLCGFLEGNKCQQILIDHKTFHIFRAYSALRLSRHISQSR